MPQPTNRTPARPHRPDDGREERDAQHRAALEFQAPQTPNETPPPGLFESADSYPRCLSAHLFGQPPLAPTVPVCIGGTCFVVRLVDLPRAAAFIAGFLRPDDFEGVESAFVEGETDRLSNGPVGTARVHHLVDALGRFAKKGGDT